MFAIVNPRKEEVTIYNKKIDAIYDHIKFNRRSGVSFKEDFSKSQQRFYERAGYLIMNG